MTSWRWCAALLAITVAMPAGAQTVGTTGNGNIAQGNFGSGTEVFGQTVTAVNNKLTSFSFSVATVAGPGNAQFFFAPITGNVVGTPIYAGTAQALTVGVNTFSGLNTAVTSGQTYIGYLTTYQVTNPVTASTFNSVRSTAPNYVAANAYAGGNFKFLNSAADPVGSTLSDRPDTDLVFSASFAPEPATWLLMIGGFGIAGGALRRRRLVTAAA